MVCLFFTNSFAQLPAGAKETFHLKVEQENRFCLLSYKDYGALNNSGWLEVMMTNGAMVEFGIKQFTLGATFLTDYDRQGTSRIDLDLGYEFQMTNSFKLQPFLGCELNSNGSGLSVGARLNKNFDLFDFISFGLFAGLRYSGIQDRLSSYNSSISAGYISASLGVYCLLYDYKRPRIIKNW